MIRRQSFLRAGCFLCPAGGQPWRGSSVGQGRQKRCHHGKKDTLAARGRFGDAPESRQNPPAPGCRTGSPGRAWKLKEEQWGALGRLLASRLTYFLWVWDKKTKGVLAELPRSWPEWAEMPPPAHLALKAASVWGPGNKPAQSR